MGPADQHSGPGTDATPLYPGGVRGFFLRTWPGRLLMAGAFIKIIYYSIELAGLPTSGLVHVFSTTGGLALAIAAIMVLVRLAQAARRNLLWRVRRKLIVSYVFIGVVPVILVVAFFLLAGRLLFNNLSSYLIQASFREMAAEANAIARTVAVELVHEQENSGATEALEEYVEQIRGQYPGLSVGFVEDSAHRCTADLPPTHSPREYGDWAHAPVPETIPDWVKCSGFSGVLALPSPSPAGSAPAVEAVVRAVAYSRGGAVVVDLPFDQLVRTRMEVATGVAVGAFSYDGQVAAAAGARRAAGGAADAAGSDLSTRMMRFQWVAMLDHVDWATGRIDPLQVQIGFSVRDIYNRLSSSQALLGDFLGALLMFIAILFLIIECGALVMGLALARSITGSIHELFTGTERVREGDFGHRITVRVKDQLGALADSFNSMTGSIEDLLRQAAEKKRLEEEMRLAREIQTSLLPPGPLQATGMAVSAMCVPAREVGGDYYDVIALEGGRVGVLIADVSGKGMSAALYMAELKGLMLSLNRIYQSPRDLLIAANSLIAEHVDSRSFITMTYAVIDPAAGTMVYARAGHTPLIYVPASIEGESEAAILAPDGMVVGLRLDNGERFESILVEATLALNPGDLLVFFTDGISEAMNEESDCFGEPRLAHLVETHAHLPIDELRERVLREIDAFVGDAPQHDDMTMILLRMNGNVCQPQ
jgi:phosphoserine phosphatase RsbU/P